MMLQGTKAQLHRGTCCYVKAPGKAFDGELGTVLDFDLAKQKRSSNIMTPAMDPKQGNRRQE